MGKGFSGLGNILNNGFGSMVSSLGGLAGSLLGGLGKKLGPIGGIVEAVGGFIGDIFERGGYADTPVYSRYFSKPGIQSSNSSAISKIVALNNNSFARGGYSDNGVYSSPMSKTDVAHYNSFARGGYSDNGVYSSPVTKTDVAHYNNIQYGSYARGGYSDNSVYSVNGFENAPEFADGGYTGRDNGPLPGGGIPTITHPNEAIVPLPDGRNIPVEIVNNNQSNNARNVNVTINVRNSSDIMRDSVRIKRMLGEVMA